MFRAKNVQSELFLDKNYLQLHKSGEGRKQSFFEKNWKITLVRAWKVILEGEHYHTVFRLKLIIFKFIRLNFWSFRIDFFLILWGCLLVYSDRSRGTIAERWGGDGTIWRSADPGGCQGGITGSLHDGDCAPEGAHHAVVAKVLAHRLHGGHSGRNHCGFDGCPSVLGLWCVPGVL